MTTHDEPRPGEPIWIDLTTTDQGRAHDFYGALFGWTVDDPGPDYGGYVNYCLDGVRVAGCMRNDPAWGTPDRWSTYLRSDDAAATMAAATARGAGVIVPAMPVGPLGTMAVITDPGSHAIGVWQPAEHRGFGVRDVPGAPAWFELHTHDYDGVRAFYRDVFAWDLVVASDEPGFRYTTAGAADAARAGIMDAAPFAEGAASLDWTVYFRVADVDASLATVERLGGTVRRAPEDTPFGRLAEIADPMGATCKFTGPVA